MIELPIVNQDILACLDDIVKEVKNNHNDLLNYYITGLDNNYKQDKKGCSEEYLKSILTLTKNYQQAKTFKIILLKRNQIVDRKLIHLQKILKDSLSGIGVLYNKGDYLGWHHNSTNDDLHDILFTYNETGEGFFKYYDKKTESIIQINDKPGWSLKAGCFPKDKNNVMWHCAYSNSMRISVAKVTYDSNKFKEYLKLISGVTV